ncbi:hypothetical protein [Desertibacillus haloalkaliphilus]|uniref:hypothetical protein n=1 Tax=Desertibacillus haloalkaliphilus TaxID=1328930 RepID=UPI001C260568|nr:hypothetical protein [Desertibacillus haloalkaliphilus]MBU8908698.1 hypothetical protein [Desertibacillus haloalkaliphilus]
MNQSDLELKHALDKFETLINDLPDNRTSVPKFKNFVVYFLRIKPKKVTLPTAELMAVLKHEKPTVFYYMRSDSSQHMIFNLVTHIDMKYETAVERLENVKQQL